MFLPPNYYTRTMWKNPFSDLIRLVWIICSTTCIIGSIFLLSFSISLDMVNFVHLKTINCEQSLLWGVRAVRLLIRFSHIFTVELSLSQWIQLRDVRRWLAQSIFKNLLSSSGAYRHYLLWSIFTFVISGWNRFFCWKLWAFLWPDISLSFFVRIERIAFVPIGIKGNRITFYFKIMKFMLFIS